MTRYRPNCYHVLTPLMYAYDLDIVFLTNEQISNIWQVFSVLCNKYNHFFPVTNDWLNTYM